MPEASENKPRIVVDDDWKEQARREKEEADKAAREQTEDARDLPAPSMAEVIHMIAMQATIGLGGLRDPQTGQAIPPDLPVAKHYIDLLGVLEQKTVGHLDEQEKAFLDGTLRELRMVFVHMVNQMGQSASPPPEPPDDK
ncbi:MAG TPA: DUF1844 domain-containing protein [Phycisphaerae bacterium]|nr:DUF1844 domain-containing protein [Phycisphaerae bacterium]